MTLERTTRSSPDLEQAVGATTRAMSDGARKLASSTKGQTVTESPPLWVEICRVLSVSKENRLDTPFSSFRPNRFLCKSLLVGRWSKAAVKAPAFRRPGRGGKENNRRCAQRGPCLRRRWNSLEAIVCREEEGEPS